MWTFISLGSDFSLQHIINFKEAFLVESLSNNCESFYFSKTRMKDEEKGKRFLGLKRSQLLENDFICGILINWIKFSNGNIVIRVSRQ